MNESLAHVEQPAQQPSPEELQQASSPETFNEADVLPNPETQALFDEMRASDEEYAEDQVAKLREELGLPVQEQEISEGNADKSEEGNLPEKVEVSENLEKFEVDEELEEAEVFDGNESMVEKPLEGTDKYARDIWETFTVTLDQGVWSSAEVLIRKQNNLIIEIPGQPFLSLLLNTFTVQQVDVFVQKYESGTYTQEDFTEEVDDFLDPETLEVVEDYEESHPDEFEALAEEVSPEETSTKENPEDVLGKDMEDVPDMSAEQLAQAENVQASPDSFSQN